MYGWMGKILRVDLSRGRVEERPLEEAVAARFIGGRGLNSKTLFDEVGPGIDPLGPDNVLCLAPGPLSGTPVAFNSRLEVSTLSPYSGILGDGNAGGGFAVALKHAGYDQIVVTGALDQPGYLWIHDGQAELRDASELWGRSTWETCDILQERHGGDVSVAGIGLAGENLVRFASTIVDRHSSAARGSGAVWGSKKLKAIAVKGTGAVPLADRNALLKLAKEDRQFFANDPLHREIVAVYGSHIGMKAWFPAYRYFDKRLAAGEVPEGLRPDAWKSYETGRARCEACPIACKDVYRIPEGRQAGEIGSGLEFETIDRLGTSCGIEDPIAIMEMANLADKHGMCTMGLGVTIAYAKELYQQGIISREDTGGVSLDWEDADSQVELIHQIIRREGFGNLVAEGLYSLAKTIGNNAMDYCYHVKGLSHGPHPPGVFALAHATSTRGADHLRGRNWVYRGKDPATLQVFVDMGMFPADMPLEPVTALVISERATTLTDSIGRCKGAVNSWACAVPLVWKYPLWDGLARVMTAATGVDFDERRLEEAADRIHTVELAFNARQGITRKHDHLPQKPEVRDSPEGADERERHAEMLSRYYELRGCDLETGIPTRERLLQLGLGDVADKLEADAPYAEWDGPPRWPLDRYPHGEHRQSTV
jgi:aldehyde:ferredoxin oxidoreductase